jgi:hypothetical protein
MSQYRDFEQADDPQAQDWDGVLLGVNERLAPENLPPGMTAGARNVRMRTGQPMTRLGVSKPVWLNVAVASNEPLPPEQGNVVTEGGETVTEGGEVVTEGGSSV